MADQIQSFLESLSPPLASTGQTSQFRQLLTSGMSSYVADYLRPQTTAKLLSNLMQSRRQGVWTNRDAGITKYVSTQFNSGAPINEFGQFIDNNGIQQLVQACGSELIWNNLATGAQVNLATLPTNFTNNPDIQYPLFPCIREFQPQQGGVTLYSIVTHPQWVEPYTINASGVAATFQLNANAGSGYWGYLSSPIVSQNTVYGYPAICEPFLGRMAYAGWPISFQTNPPAQNSPTVYDILITNFGFYNTVTQSAPLEATDGIRLQVPAICGRPTALRTIQLNNNSNSQALLVGCINGVCIIQGTDATNMALVILTTEFGIPTNRAIIPILNDAIFLANDGIRSFSAVAINSNLLTSSLSYGLQDLVQTWDTTWLNQAFAVRHRQTKDIQFWMPQLNENGTSNGAVSVVNTGATFVAANSQSLSIASNASLQISSSIAFTWAGWVSLASLTGPESIISKAASSGGGTTGDYLLSYDSIGNYFTFATFTGSGTQAVSATTFGAPALNTYVFVVASYNGAGALSIAINNGAANTVASGITPAASTAAFSIGTDPSGQYLNGAVQCVGFWKRTLTSLEQTTLYNAGVPLLYNQLPSAMQSESATTFISYWNLNELAGVRRDSRSTGNNLTSNNNVGTVTTVPTYTPAQNNLAFVYNYGDSSFAVQAIPALTFTPSIRQYLTQAAAIEFQDPNNANQWTMFGGGYNGYLYEHYDGNLNDGMSLPWQATFPLISSGNDAVDIEFEKIHIICEGAPGQNFFANCTFFEMMANGSMLPQNAQQATTPLISSSNSKTVLGTWILGQSAFPGTFLQFLEYYPTGNGRYAQLSLTGSASNNIIDMIGSHYLLQTDSTRQ